MAEPNILAGLDNIADTQHKIDWQYFREGIEIYPLSFHDSNTPASALLRYQPGAEVPSHKHPGYEHILILSGSQQDEKGSYKKGTLLISPPGSQHSVKSKQGCIVLAIWEKAVQFNLGASD